MITREAFLTNALYLNALICNNLSLIQPLELDFPFHAAFFPQDQHYVALSTAELSPSSTVLCKAPQVLHERQCSWPSWLHRSSPGRYKNTSAASCCDTTETWQVFVCDSLPCFGYSFSNYGPITKNTMKSISIERSISNEGKVHH